MRCGHPTRRFLIKSAAKAATLTWAQFGLSTAARSYDLPQGSFQDLRTSLDGAVILPGDPVYNSARRPVSYNPQSNHYPVAIIYCESDSDVLRSIEFASKQGLPLAARSGGCDILGRSSCDGGVVIDLSILNATLAVDRTRTVTVGAGASAGQVTGGLAAQGMVVPLGCDPMVGVGGLTLGGGLGWLLGKYGAACDSLIAADVATANGDIVRASVDDNPDLLWALKGGGGNFGIVTSMDFQCFEVGPVIGGYIVYPISAAREFLYAYPDLMASAPRELMVELASIDTARGPVVVAMTCFSGDDKFAETVLEPFLTFGAPLANDIGVRDYQNVGTPSDEMIRNFPPPEVEPRITDLTRDSLNYWRGCNLQEVTETDANNIADAIESAPPGATFGLGHFMKGASVDISPEKTAMPRRPGSMCAYYSASWSYDDESDNRIAWVDQATTALSQYSNAPTYINYLSSEKEDDIQASYGENYSRLSKVKSIWDPENIFSQNRNIRPG